MILTINYDKTSGDITVSSDVSSIDVQLNTNSVSDDASEVSFEVAIDTTSYEEINKLPVD